MEGWNKIGAFGSIYQAEMQKILLEDYGIEAVILNEQDSSFLMGDVELYVKEEDAQVAQELLVESLKQSETLIKEETIE